MSDHSRVPSYRRHKQSGQAVVTLSDGQGGRRDVLLGKYGTRESRTEYARVIAEWEAAGRTLPKSPAAPDLLINELLKQFTPWAEQHYRHPDGTPTKEISEYKFSLRPLRRLYGLTPVKDFGPLALKALRQAMIDGTWLNEKEKDQRRKNGKPPGLCRGVVNQRIGRIRRMFRWAVENELVAPAVLQALLAVRGIPKGRGHARETEPVRPVPDAFVESTLPYLRPQVAAMVQLQRHTGMRPGEVVIMRGIDLDTSGRVWLYRPGSDCGPEGAHKTAYRGHTRIVPIGPRAQEILRPWLRLNVQEYLFSPRESMQALAVERRSGRKTRVQPSQQNRQKRKRKKVPGDHYAVSSYGHAIRDAVEAVNRVRSQANEVLVLLRSTGPLIAAELASRLEDKPEAAIRKALALLADYDLVAQQGETWRAVEGAAELPDVPHWHPHQLRHTMATELRREAGLDAARVVLGHRSPAITETYAELDTAKAAQVMERLG